MTDTAVLSPTVGLKNDKEIVMYGERPEILPVDLSLHADDDRVVYIDLDETRPQSVTSNLGLIPSPNDYLNIYALPVGDGDATIIQCPGGELIVVDMGSSSEGWGWNSNQVKTYLGSQLEMVSTIVVTKGTSEHYNYIPRVFSGYNGTTRIILGGRSGDYTDSTFLTWINQRAHILEYVNGQQPCISKCSTTPPQCRSTSSVKFVFLGANLGYDRNGRSLLLQVQVDNPYFRLLLPGDFEGTDIENLVVREWEWENQPITSTHYKISNAGRGKTSNSPLFLSSISPQYAFSSNGYPSNKNGSPNCTVISQLISRGAINKRQNSGSYACYDAQEKAITQYTSWVYDIFTTTPYPYQVEIIKINVPVCT